MAFTGYYGAKHGTTYLDIYSVPEAGGERVLHRQLQDQAAYDAWHLSHYFQEMLSYRKLLTADRVAFDDIPRKDKNLLLYLLLACRPQLQTVLELGSTLYEMVDGLRVVQRYAETTSGTLPAIDPRRLRFIGIEISELFAFASQELHPGYTIDVVSDVTKPRERAELVYDRSVTNYAFETAEEVARFVNTSEVALLNCYLSKGRTFQSARLGKPLTYFSLEELVAHLNRPLYHLFGTRAPSPVSGQDLSLGRPVIEGFFLCADPDVAADFMATAQRDPAVQGYFQQKEIVLKDAVTCLEASASTP